jgi:hypothetical protein
MPKTIVIESQTIAMTHESMRARSRGQCVVRACVVISAPSWSDSEHVCAACPAYLQQSTSVTSLWMDCLARRIPHAKTEGYVAHHQREGPCTLLVAVVSDYSVALHQEC